MIIRVLILMTAKVMTVRQTRPSHPTVLTKMGMARMIVQAVMTVHRHRQPVRMSLLQNLMVMPVAHQIKNMGKTIPMMKTKILRQHQLIVMLLLPTRVTATPLRPIRA